MMENEIIVGLDIGTTKIAVLVGRKNEHGKLEILGKGKAESVGVMRGMVERIGPTVQSIQKAIEEATEASGVQINEVMVGIAGQHIKSIQHHDSITRNDQDKEIDARDIEELIAKVYKLAMPPGERIIDAIPQEFTVDNGKETNDPIGMPASRLEANFHVITAQVNAAENIKKCVNNAGLDVLQMTLEPLASAEAILNEDEKEAGVCLVDIGGGTTDVAVFHENVLRHTAVIPFGGNIITEDIKEGCSVIKKHAEKMKVLYGSALSSANQGNEIIAIPGIKGRESKEISVKNLAAIIEARMEEIIHQVVYELQSCNYIDKLNAGIVVTGGGSQLKHLTQLFEFITGLDTRIGYPTEYLANSIEELTSPSYATGVGLVLKGFELKRNQAVYGTDNKTETEKPIEKTRTSFFKRVMSFLEDDIDKPNTK